MLGSSNPNFWGQYEMCWELGAEHVPGKAMSDLMAAGAGTKHFSVESEGAAHLAPEQVLDCRCILVLASVLWLPGEEGAGKGGLCQALALGWTCLPCPVSRLQSGVNLLLPRQTGSVPWDQLKAGFHGRAAGP